MSFVSTFIFWSISLLLACTPGADWAYVLSSAIKQKSPRPSVAGLVLGYLGLVVIVAVGAATLIESIPGALETLTIVGALYLIWVGISIFRNPPRAHTADGAVPTSARKVLTSRPGISKVMGLFSGVVMVIIGLLLLGEQTWR